MNKLTVLFFLALITYIQGTTYLVGPTRTYTSPAAVINAGVFHDGDVMILDDATYNVTFGIYSATGWTIKSASGNPYACIINGQKGVGAGHKLTAGKGTLYTQRPGTIQGIGFINGGGGDGVADGEAGVYAELFPSMGTLYIVNCAFDGNENGIFVPGYANGAPGANVQIYLGGCVFSKKQGNGVDGYAHNYYINGWNLTSVGCTHLPSYLGNNVKSRSRYITINDLYNRHDQGRAIDIPSGGQFTMHGGVYTSLGDSAVSNFMEYSGENSDSGLFNVLAIGLTIYCARNNDYIWNANPTSVTWTFTNTTQYWAGSGYQLHLSSGVTGITTTGTNYHAVPAPIYPSWVQ